MRPKRSRSASGVSASPRWTSSRPATEPEAAIAAALRGGRPQLLTACYRVTALAVLQAHFDAGERAVRRAAAPLTITPVAGLDEVHLGDADTPEALRDLLGRIL